MDALADVRPGKAPTCLRGILYLKYISSVSELQDVTRETIADRLPILNMRSAVTAENRDLRSAGIDSQ